MSLFTIYLYFNSIKFAIIIAILIINIYYLLYKNIYESFDEYAADRACANLTGIIENQYNDKANEKYYEYCQLSGLNDDKKYKDNLLGPLGAAYPYDITGKVLKHPTDNNFKYRHDLSFRQWMIYNYESLHNNIPANGSFSKLTTAPRGTAIISITDEYIKSLQGRGISKCRALSDTKISVTSQNAIKWDNYDVPLPDNGG